jgi:6-pyruvoyltetrahydropterin/6-carboxytetrahydropterin synthase
MFSIQRTFHFYAAHFLRGLPEGHKCTRLHGHTYRVVLVVANDALQGPGFVREFSELDAFENEVKAEFDHKTLNDVSPFDKIEPTTENLAHYLYLTAKRLFPETVEVRVSETESTWVTYRESLDAVTSRQFEQFRALVKESDNSGQLEELLKQALGEETGP